MRYLFILLISMTFTTITLHAQDSESLAWSSVSITKTLDAKNSIAFKPIIRHNNNITQYQNFSLDASYKRQLGKGWFAQGITRYWFIPDNTNRFFLWFDIGYGKKIKNSKISSHIRYHHAADIKDRIDADFLRWKTKWTFPAIGRFTPELSLEPWYRVDAVHDLVRMRYEPGINYKINDAWKLSGVYRREINKGDAREFDAAVINLGYKF